MNYGPLKVSVSSLFYVDDLELLLLGIGGHVELIDVKELKLLQRLPIFKDTTHTPHGFVQVPHKKGSEGCLKFLIFGGKFIRCILLDSKEKKITSCESDGYQFYDWILDVCVWKEDIYAITAHNEVIRLIRNNDETEEKTTNEVILKPDEKCILYSAKIVCESDTELVFLGGTVFRQVIVYAYSGSETVNVSHRLDGHEGVIFSIQYHKESNLICSTSDDRTARLWKVEKGTDHSGLSWNDCRIFPLHVLNNCHASRIFRCIFISKSQVITGGEDSALALWSTETGECQSTWKAHDGSPIWSLAYNKSSNQIITGGGDGSVKRFSCDLTRSLRLIDLDLETSDYPKLVALDKNNPPSILVLTWKGVLLEVDTSFEKAPKILLKDPELEKHAIMKRSLKFTYFATLNGKIKWLPHGSTEFYQENSMNGKILAFEVLDKSDKINLLVCGLNGLMKLYEHKEVSTLIHLYNFDLPQGKEQRIFSCCLKFQSYLLIGDRDGSLHVYSANEGRLLHTVPKVHSRQGIGFIETMDDDQSQFFTGGRDGKLTTFTFNSNCDVNAPQMSISQNLKVNWLERLIDVGNGNYCVLGFHSSSFVVHSISDAVNLSEVTCGGGHRSWDFNGVDFAFIKDRQLMFCKEFMTSDASMTIKTGLHSLVINCVEHCHFGSKDYLFTGSEDTFIKVISATDSELKLEQTLRSHLSSVRAMHLVDYTNDKKFLVSAGGRAEFKIWLLNFNAQRNVISVAEVASKMLKGNDKQRQKSWKDHEMIDDTETRYLSVQVKLVDNVLVILTACSDGVLRLWNWEINSKKVALISETDVMDNAILKVVWHDIGFLAADTLGNITFRNLPDLKVNWKLSELHENGINALCIDSNRIAFSGGDDGSITISDLQGEKILHKNRQISAAHITGIQTVDIGDSVENLISVSVDQRITRWLVNREDKSISVLNQSLSSVPDIHDMVAWVRKTQDGDQTLVAMVGNGIEIMYF